MSNYNRKITSTLMVIIATLVILGIIAITGQKNVFGEATIIFNLDHEISLPNWFSTILLFSLSCLTFFIAFTKTVLKKEYSTYWQWLGFIFLLMSIEEVASFRDSLLTIPLRNSFNLTGIFYYSWVIPIGLLVIIFLFLYTKFILDLPPKVRNFFVLGIIVYILGAIGFELFGGWVIADRSLIDSYEFITIIEETFELLGVTFLIHALLMYICHDSWEMLTLEKIKDSDINIGLWQTSIFVGFALLILVVSITGFLSYRNRDYVSLTTLHMWDNLPMEAPPNQDAIIFGDDILPFWGASYEYQDNWDLIDVNLWWWTQSAPEDNYSIGVYLLNSEGLTVAQTDGAINDLYYDTIETSQMEANRIYVDQRLITVPEDLPSGDYSLYLAVYQWWDGVKLELENGEDLLLIGDIVIP